MFRALSLGLAAITLVFPAFIGAGVDLRAQGNCENCDLPPGCRGVGNQKPGKNNGRDCRRLDITIQSDIDFGRVVLLGHGEGRIVLDLTTGEKRLIGDVDDLGGVPITGRAMVTGAPFEAVEIDFPNEVDMRDPTGGSARIRDFETDLPGYPTLDANGQLEFRFSGTLVIEANTNASGNLRGRVPISVEYP